MTDATGDADGSESVRLAVSDPDINRLLDVGRLLDDSIRIPGTSYRVGVEPLIGLLPVVGDAAGVAFSAYVLAVTVRSGAPRATVARVACILWIDAIVGTIPVVGDLFDAYWKANLRSARLLETRLADPASAAADRRYLRRLVAAVAGLSLVVTALLAAGAWWLARAI
ncbi:DUF4112 domain-containing protein [Haloplanus sp. C73]|uniref:DUF4112 domain-containing protein n=1 Tax=Haloplanus sp. C73 TaxID=3421641 RepID=UPI003EBA006E